MRERQHGNPAQRREIGVVPAERLPDRDGAHAEAGDRAGGERRQGGDARSGLGRSGENGCAKRDGKCGEELHGTG
jgi:hypothetical protein